MSCSQGAFILDGELHYYGAEPGGIIFGETLTGVDGGISTSYGVLQGPPEGGRIAVHPLRLVSDGAPCGGPLPLWLQRERCLLMDIDTVLDLPATAINKGGGLAIGPARMSSMLRLEFPKVGLRPPHLPPPLALPSPCLYAPALPPPAPLSTAAYLAPLQPLASRRLKSLPPDDPHAKRAVV